MTKIAELDCSEGCRAVDLLAGQSLILELIARGSPSEEVLTSLARLIESRVGALCSILLLDEDGRLCHGAAPSLPAEYTKAIDGVRIGPKTGSCGTAAFLGKPVIVADILEDPLWDDYRHLATPHGLRACWSTPFFSRQGKVLGTFAMYYRMPRTPGPSEAQLIELATRLASIAVERSRSDDDLRKAEQKYRSIVEEAVVGIFQSEPEGRYISVNPALARMLGYDSPEDLKASIVDLARQLYVDPARRDEFRQSLQAEGSVRDFECEVRRKNGSKMWFSVNARTVRAEGRVVAFEGIAEDVTPRKILERKLVQAQKMEAIGQLAGGIAHDFNNILGVILGHGELIKHKLLPADPMRRRIEQICRAGDRAVSLTKQLLAFSRQQVLNPVVLDLNSVVNHVNEMLTRLIGEDIRVVIQQDPALAPILADSSQMEQILMNLAVNARDAMPLGGTLTIATSNFEIDPTFAQNYTGTKAGNYVQITVIDTGLGMDQETLGRVFEPFFTTKAPGKGTGLGLATVYGIVKQTGGFISVTSEPGRGTTFRIYFLSANGPARIQETQQPMAGPAIRTNETILLVEDAEALRDVTREFLEGSGYRVLEAATGEEALEIGRRHPEPISLMITDVVMPGMNGSVLAERLQLSRPTTKVLYVSGYADEAIFRHGVQPSGTNFLHKPFTKDKLLGKLRELLDTPVVPSTTATPLQMQSLL